MNSDQMIEALANNMAYASSISSSKTPELYWGNLAQVVLNLCGPEPLVWNQPFACFHRANILRGCYEVYGGDGDWWAVLMVSGTGYCIGQNIATADLAQAAAQDHATAAHWANTPLVKLVGVV